MSRVIPAILGLFLLAAPAFAQQEDRDSAAAAAANASAVNKLLLDVQAEPLARGVTVKDLLDKTQSMPALVGLLNGAQQIGGPRWLDDQTCEVRLEVPGAAVAQKLAQIVVHNPQSSPVTAAQLKAATANWSRRTFAAVGTSTAQLDQLLPPATAGAWASVPEPARREAVAAARADAVARVVNSIKPVPLAAGKTAGDALADPDVGGPFAAWLSARPVTLVDFRDDHQVEVTLAATPTEAGDRFRALVAPQRQIPQPADAKGWDRFRNDFAREMASPVGRAAVGATTQPAVATLPAQPPDWVGGQLDADGAGPAGRGGTRLHAARAAEAAAIDGLRRQVRALPADGGKTLGDLADADPRFAATLDHAIRSQSHLYKADYHPDGAVAVRVSLDLRDLWEQIAPRR